VEIIRFMKGWYRLDDSSLIVSSVVISLAKCQGGGSFSVYSNVVSSSLY